MKIFPPLDGKRPPQEISDFEDNSLGLKMGSKVQVIPHGMTVEEFMEKGSSIRNSSADMNSLTSADYYADSYGHFGIHGTSCEYSSNS